MPAGLRWDGRGAVAAGDIRKGEERNPSSVRNDIPGSSHIPHRATLSRHRDRTRHARALPGLAGASPVAQPL